MRVATLIVNPMAGRARLLGVYLPALKALLARHGYTARVVDTTAEAGSGARLAAEASSTSALVLACGGDGTVHSVVQGLAHTGTPLGIVPMGTHNALGGALGLPADPLVALERLLTWEPRLIPLGQMMVGETKRYFVTMAGCGPSGALAHALAGRAGSRNRWGRAIYPLYAARLFATRRWPAFRLMYRLAGEPAWQSVTAAALLVSRVPSLGGVFARLTPGASLDAPGLHAYVLPAPLQVTLPAWFAASAAGLPNPWLQRLEVEELRCTPLGRRPILMQADAEPLGCLPCTLRVVPDALALLMP